MRPLARLSNREALTSNNIAQYCRYTGEIKTGKNVKQIVNRALQFATQAPQGPVYLYGAREPMEEDLEPYSLKQGLWGTVRPVALTEDAVAEIATALAEAEQPLVVTGYSGRNHATPGELVKLADTIPGLRVLDSGGSDMSFPSDHSGSLGLRYGVHDSITTADVILVADCDVPWIPTLCKPKPSARIFHIDVDPLKQQMPVGWIEAEGIYKADCYTAFKQLHTYISHTPSLSEKTSTYSSRRDAVQEQHTARKTMIQDLAQPSPSGSFNASYLTARIRASVPDDTIFAVEAVTNTAFVADQLAPQMPGTWLNCGGGGLGWSGGAALGIKLAAGPQRFVCQIVADGTFLFSVPGSVYWISQRYKLPVLTIVLNNTGWHAPRRSLLLVHPDGYGSKVSNEELNISFAPSPDYAGIAKAAAGGNLWAGKAGTVGELAELLPKAVESVMNGVGAVLDCCLDAPVQKTGEQGVEKGDSVLVDGEAERGGGKAVLVG